MFCLLAIFGLVAAAHAAGKPPNKCEDGCRTFVEFCEGAMDDWDPVGTPLEQKNQIGRMAYLNDAKTLAAVGLISQGKKLTLQTTMGPNAPVFPGRSLGLSLRVNSNSLAIVYKEDFDLSCDARIGYNEQSVLATSLGNTGTQFDGLGHVMYHEHTYDTRRWYFWNNISFAEVVGQQGLKAMSVPLIPPIITTAWLIDVAGYYNVSCVPQAYELTSSELDDILAYQGFSINDIQKGDILVLHFGYLLNHWDQSYLIRPQPGYGMEFIENVLIPKGIILTSCDNLGCDTGETRGLAHSRWLNCAGGLNHESVNTTIWALEAQAGNAPYKAAYFYEPMRVEGAVGAAGGPVILY